MGVSEYSMAGTYRKVMHLPGRMDHSVLRYDDPNQPLALTDEDIVLGRSLPPTNAEGQHVALQFELQLGTSSCMSGLLGPPAASDLCHPVAPDTVLLTITDFFSCTDATMALRELLKAPTNALAQKVLTESRDARNAVGAAGQ